MFRSEEMCELSLLVRGQDVEEVTRAIARGGALHQVDTSYLSRAEDWESEPWQDRIQQYQGLEQRILLIMGALGLEQNPLLGDVDEGGDLAIIRDRVMEVEHEIMPLVNQLRAEEARLTELDTLIQRLRPIADLDIDLAKLRNLTFLNAQIGIVPAANLDRFNASLLHVPHVMLTLGTQGAGTLLALFGSAKDREVLERAAHSAYMGPISMPEGYRGTPVAILDRLEAEVAELKASRAESDQRAIEAATKWGPTLVSLLRRIRMDLTLLRAVDRFGQVRDVYLIAGWVPTRKTQEVIDAVQRVTSGQVAVDITPAGQSGDTAGVPTTMDHRGFLRAFQGLVTNYAFPSYGEIDPTILVAFTFVIMFGIMFGDVGHGLVLALVGLASMMGWVKKLKSVAGVAPVLLAGGLAAMTFGFLYGSVFGIDDLLPAIWLRPLDDIMSILLATVAVGVFFSLIGFAANILNGLQARDWRRVLFDRFGLAGLWFYLGLIGIVGGAAAGISLPSGVVLAAILLPPLGLIVAGEPLANLIARRRPLIHESAGMFLIEGFFELFESLLGYLSNSLSYVRLGAFAVAHGGLMSVFFILAGMVGGGRGSVLYWVIVAFGNAFIIGFEGLIVGIQTLRLEYYEFFGKFFKGGGVPYKPLKLSGGNT